MNKKNIFNQKCNIKFNELSVSFLNSRLHYDLISRFFNRTEVLLIYFDILYVRSELFNTFYNESYEIFKKREKKNKIIYFFVSIFSFILLLYILYITHK